MPSIPLLYRQIVSGEVCRLQPSQFLPTFVQQRWKRPEINKKQLGHLRKLASVDGIDACKVLGLPPVAKSPPLKDVEPQPSLRAARKVARIEHVERLMRDMPETVRRWKEGKRQERLCRRQSELPF